MLSIKKTILCFVFASLFSAPFKQNFQIQGSNKEVLKTALVFTLGSLLIADAYISVKNFIYHTNQKNQAKAESEKQVITFADIIGLETTITKFKEVADFLQNPTKYQQLGADIPHGILIAGPPGTGKSMLVKALATETNSSLSYQPASELSNKYAGKDADYVHYLFHIARTMAIQTKRPSIIFIDNIDHLETNLDTHWLEKEEYKKTIQALAEEMNDLYYKEMNQNIFVVATTNKPQTIPPILLQPGKFDITISIPLPTQENREKIFSHYLNHINLNPSLDIEATAILLAKETDGYSSADIAHIVGKAALIAAQNHAVIVTMEHLLYTCSQFSPDYNSEIPLKPKKITFKDIVGLNEVIEEIVEVSDFLQNPKPYKELGAKLPGGILLEGPPGTGKTMLARALASHIDATFIHKSASEFVNMYVGAGASNIRNLFTSAHKAFITTKKPTIIFIDEIDAIGSRINVAGGSGGDAEYRQTINELLNQMDGFVKNENIIVVAATNNIEMLDPAILRPGRFDRKITVPLPTQDGRKKIFEYYLEKITLDSSLQSKKIANHFAKQTTGLSGADIANVVNEATLIAAREKSIIVTIQHLETAYDRISLGLKTKMNRTEKELKRTAYHEAGHTVMALLTGQPVSKVTILSRGNTGGVTFTKTKYEYTSMYTKEELLDQIMMLQGGFVAEKIIFNIKTPGAQSDLQHANKLAQTMVNNYGMGDGALESRTIDSVSAEATKKEFDDAVSRILEKCKKQTTEMLTKKKELLANIAETLLKKETLDEAKIYQIFKEAGSC